MSLRQTLEEEWLRIPDDPSDSNLHEFPGLSHPQPVLIPSRSPPSQAATPHPSRTAPKAVGARIGAWAGDHVDGQRFFSRPTVGYGRKMTTDWILLNLVGSYWISLDLLGSYWILLVYHGIPQVGTNTKRPHVVCKLSLVALECLYHSDLIPVTNSGLRMPLPMH